jgi:hypothetical protein
VERVDALQGRDQEPELKPVAVKALGPEGDLPVLFWRWRWRAVDKKSSVLSSLLRMGNLDGRRRREQYSECISQ